MHVCTLMCPTILWCVYIEIFCARICIHMAYTGAPCFPMGWHSACSESIFKLYFKAPKSEKQLKKLNSVSGLAFFDCRPTLQNSRVQNQFLFNTYWVNVSLPVCTDCNKMWLFTGLFQKHVCSLVHQTRNCASVNRPHYWRLPDVFISNESAAQPSLDHCCSNIGKLRFFAISQAGGNAVAPVQNFARRQYFRKGAHTPKNGEKLRKHCLYQAPKFSNFGGPYLWIGGRYPHAITALG